MSDSASTQRWEYHVTLPSLRPAATSPVMDCRDMTDWLNEMDEAGWEFVGYGQKNWVDKLPQSWWIFRRPLALNDK